jgi:amino acid adenylation domain-containing protein
MSDLSKLVARLPKEQQAIRAKCFHPTATFFEFKKEELEQSIPERFEKIVQMYPDRLAVKTKEHALTYGELNKAANRVARAILAKQGEKQEPVALLLEQGIQAITAILGVLKAGRFYVFLDPSFPHARIVSILEDSRARLLVTDEQSGLLSSKLTNTGLQRLNVDGIDSNISSENPGLFSPPEGLACIIYTSGSTGQPKGVVHNHRGLLHWAMVHTNLLHICLNDRLTLLHSFSVASSMHNFLGSLLNGASLFPFNPRLGGLELANWVIDEQITIYHSVSTVLRQMMDSLTREERFPNLRVIRLSGMAATQEDALRYKRQFSPDCILVHVLGTTEAGTIPHYFIDQAIPIHSKTLPVGYAAEDTELVLLDDQGRQVAHGEVGEIAIKSRYLALGYWGKSELTKAKFLPDPDAGEERIYLTGDLGRMGPDGCLFHLGRRDFQVKVRGYRVETNEVEIALIEHPDIKDAAVVGAADQNADMGLIAYFVPTKEPGPSISELQRFLRMKLPDHMVPSAFMVLERMPLTPSGKLDRRALPTPGNSRPELDTPFTEPRTTREQELARIWGEVLSLDRVGIHDNFFELGGHSLKATQVMSRLSAAFHVELPLRALFESPTIAGLAAIITQRQIEKSKDSQPAS